MDKKKMVEALIDHYSNGNKSEFGRLLGLSPQCIASWLARGTFDPVVIYKYCEGVSGDWLLGGGGDMLRKLHKQEPSVKVKPAPSEERTAMQGQLDELRNQVSVLQSRIEALVSENAVLRYRLDER